MSDATNATSPFAQKLSAALASPVESSLASELAAQPDSETTDPIKPIPAALKKAKNLKKAKPIATTAEQEEAKVDEATSAEEVQPTRSPAEPEAAPKPEVTRVTVASLLQGSVGQTHLVRQVISDAERLRTAQDCVDVMCIGITRQEAASPVGRLLHPFSPIRLRLTSADNKVQEYPSAAAMAIASIWPNMAEAAQRLPDANRHAGRFSSPIMSGPMAMDWLTAQCNTHNFNWMVAPDTQRWHLRQRLIEATWARLLCYSDSEEFQRVISALPVVPQMDSDYKGDDEMRPVRAKDLPLVMWNITRNGDRTPHPMSAWWVGVARKMLGWAGSAWRTGQANAEILNRHAEAMAEWKVNGEQGRPPVQPKLHAFDPTDEIQRLAGFVRPLVD